MREAVQWDSVPMLFVPLVRCPSCTSPDGHTIVRTFTEADGSITRRCICRACSRPFLLIVDPTENSLPETGRDDYPTS
jgi:hypothetical protein